MSYSIVGEQIQKFRKEMRLTQRELGEALGVSSSAVSQWESGGTPDVALLPAIADKLRVTVDALFGREGGDVQDMEQTACRWIRSFPEEQRLDQICRLAFEMIKYGCFVVIEPPGIEYTKSCEIPDEDGGKALMPSVACTDHGIATGVFAEDMSFVSFFPEPEAGYKAYLSSYEEYREFFGVLAQPDVLEVIMGLASGGTYYTPGAAAKRAGISHERAKEVLDILVKAHMANPLELESEEGEVSAYCLRKEFHMIPLLYFARLLMQNSEIYYMNWVARKKPLL